MKTMEQFFYEVMTNEETNKKFQAATDEKMIEALLKENEVDCTLDDFRKFFTEKIQASGELSDEALENVAGGVGDWLKGSTDKDFVREGWDTLPDSVKEIINKIADKNKKRLDTAARGTVKKEDCIIGDTSN